MKSWIFGATLLLAVFANPAVFAAKAITQKAQLEKDATHVVVGKVRSISSTKRVKGSGVSLTTWRRSQLTELRKEKVSKRVVSCRSAITRNGG